MLLKRIATAAAVTPIAGGTGANTGGFLGSAPRNTALTTINLAVTLANALKSELNAMINATKRFGIADAPLVTAPDVVALLAGPDGANLTGAAAGCYENNVTRTTALLQINAAIDLANELEQSMDRPMQALIQRGYVSPARGAALLPSGSLTLPLTVISGNDGNAGNNGGGFNDAVARDLAITNLTALKTLLNDVTDKLMSFQVKLQNAGVLVS